MRADRVLEFEELRELLGQYVHSPMGRAELERLNPSSDRASIEASLADLKEGAEYWNAASRPQIAGRGAASRPRFEMEADPAELLGRLRIQGSTLDAQEIFELARLLEMATEVRSMILASRDHFPRLVAHAVGIADLQHIAREISGKILPDGSLADDASVALGRIRRDSEKQRKSIEDSLHRFLRAHREDGTMQEDFVTIRNDRFVVPVISGRERRVDGVIHGSSGSGHTVFVEPLETIQLNNELVRLREEELREVHRLLREFTNRMREHAVEIAASVEAMGRLELIFAKAQFASEFYCCVPTLSPVDRRAIKLRAAKHPLLQAILRRQKKSVVSMSLTLEGDRRTLLISGPNTGGKTVALKTIGLLALMTHAGLPVPADEAEFPLFDQVLADIGDHQSLQESLSSFSSHVVAVKSMLEEATGDSLILLDELGRATDPEEGGALGVVILDEFRSRGGFTLASTHLTAMKVYGASTTGVLNGSMGFDDQTLAPTYMLRLGAPGKSAGLEIASRLGLDSALIASARERMSSSERDVGRFLAELNQRLAVLETEQAQVAEREQKIAAREQTLELTWERKYGARLKELEEGAAKLAGDFERRAEETINDLSGKARARIAKTQREYRESVAELAPTPVSKTANAAPRPKLVEGARVRLKGVRQPATVRRLLNDGGLEVEAGFLKMKIRESDIEEILAPGDAPARPQGIRVQTGPSFSESFREINVIGHRAEEACNTVDKFLDNAALGQVERVRIVHGHGMGILKNAIAELLAGNPHVERFYLAPPEEGGSGATIAELK